MNKFLSLTKHAFNPFSSASCQLHQKYIKIIITLESLPATYTLRSKGRKFAEQDLRQDLVGGQM